MVTKIIPMAAIIAAMALPYSALGGVESGSGGVPPDMSQDTSTTPSEYSIPPVVPKSLKPADSHPWNHKQVKSMKGENLGTLDHVMIDPQSGKEMYGMLKLSDSAAPIPIPFNRFKESETGLTVNVSKAQLQQSPGGPNLGGATKSQDFEHMGGESLKPNLRGGGG